MDSRQRKEASVDVPDHFAGADESTTVIVSPADNGLRIDALLALRLPGKLTRSRIQRALKDGGVLLDGEPIAKVSVKVRAGSRVEWLRDAKRETPGLVVPEDIPLDIQHEDEACIVLDKPAGMCVHPAKGIRSGTLVNALLFHVGHRAPLEPQSTFAALDPDESASDRGSDAEGGQEAAKAEEARKGPEQQEEQQQTPGHLGDGVKQCVKSGDGMGAGSAAGLSAGLSRMACSGGEGEKEQQLTAEIVRPGIVHRLDRGTTGVMVVAKQEAAHAAIMGQFAARTTKRTYVALVWGTPVPKSGTIHGAIGRDPGDRLRMTVVPDGKGKHAITHYDVIEELDNGHVSLARFRLETGRTHQIRVHARHLGHPLVGDATYGGAQLLRGPQTASRVAFYRRLLGPHDDEAGRGPSKLELGQDCSEGRALVIIPLLRPALHAETLEFSHPSSGSRMAFSSPTPADMSRCIEALR